MSVKITYELPDRGWCRCAIVIDDQTCQVTGSYLFDVTRDFLEIVASLVGGCSEGRFSFFEEPGEYRWILKRNFQSEFTLVIMEFDQGFLVGQTPDEKGKKIFEGHCDITRLGFALKRAMDNLINQHGLEGYKALWREEFPIEKYRLLCEKLGRKPAF